MSEQGTNGQPDKALLERVGEIDQRIRQRCAGIRREGIELAEDFHAFDEERGWELQGCEKVTEYLADPTIEVPYSTYRGMVQVYEELVVQREIPKDRIATVQLYKLQLALPAIRKGGADVDEVISDAEVLGPQDFRAKYRGELGPGKDDELVQCPTCNTFVQPEKLEEAA